MIYALLLFAVTYVLMLAFSKYRPYIAVGSAVIFIATGMLPFDQILGAIDFNVLLMIAGTMGLVQLFIDSKMPALLADLIMEKVPNVQMAAVALALFAGIISAFVDNVATVLMVAPIAMEICKKLKTNPVPFIIGIAVSSNLQGAATLVGDTTAIMLGSYAGMSFLDFFFYRGRPSIFWAVELGAVASALILAFLFRKEKGAIPKGAPRTKVTDYVPTVLLVGMIALLISASFIQNKPDITNGVICVGLMLIGMVYTFCKTHDSAAAVSPLKSIDFETIGLLFGLFLVIGGITHMGVVDAAAGLLARMGGGNVFVIYTAIVWASVLFSAFIDLNMYLAKDVVTTNYLASVALILFGCLIQSIGVVLEIKPNVTMMSAEGFVKYASSRYAKDFGSTKVVFDSSLVACAVIVSLIMAQRIEGVREGTVIAACITGYIVRFLSTKVMTRRRLSQVVSLIR